MASTIGNTISETAAFTKQANGLWTETELEDLRDFLAMRPLAGDEIPGTGGIRKLRWSRAGMGKRGGARVIYYYYDDRAPVYLLWAYAKGQQEDLSPKEKLILTRAAETLKANIKANRRQESGRGSK